MQRRRLRLILTLFSLFVTFVLFQNCTGELSTPKLKVTDQDLNGASTDTVPPTPDTPPVAPVEVVAVNAGGGTLSVGSRTYLADTHYSAGTTAATTASIQGTANPSLYQSERYGAQTYTIPVTNSSYRVTLHMAEIYAAIVAAGQRVFTIKLQPGTAQEVTIADIDIFAAVGALTAYDISRDVVVANGQLVIQLIAQKQEPKINGFSITSTAGGKYTPPPPGNSNASQSWLDLLKTSLQANPDLTLAGGGQIPFNQPGSRFGSTASVRAALQGTPASEFANNMGGIAAWPWVYAGAGHTATNYGIEVRRVFAQIKRASTSKWEFVYHSGRAIAARWNGGTPTGEYNYQGDNFNRYYTPNSSLAVPFGNLGLEMWASDSQDSPHIGTGVNASAGIAGVENRALLADMRNVCVGVQLRVVKLSGADANPSQIKFLAAVGWDFFWLGSGAPSSRYLSGGWPGHAIDGGGSKWVPLRTDGQWQWVVAVGGDFGVSDWIGDPFPRPNPYNNAPLYSDTWDQVEANPPIDMTTYYSN